MYGPNRLDFVSCKTFQSSVIKCSSLLDPYISYEENEVLWIHLWGPYSQLYIFFIIYVWTQQARIGLSQDFPGQCNETL